MQDDSSLTRRLGRIASVGGTLTGTALKTFGAKLSGQHDKIPQLLTDALGKLKGPAMKVGQILAMVPGMLPDEIAENLMQLQSNAPSMGWPFVRRRMAAELGPEWQRQFKSFERNAAAAASLGQVHKAHLLDETPVACKLQYPNMLDIIQGDLDQLTLLMKTYEKTVGVIDTDHMRAELKDRLIEELDYTLERDNMTKFQTLFETSDHSVTIPSTYPSHSTHKLLTMEWVDGTNLMTVKTWSKSDRERIAKNLFNAWYYPLYSSGLLHGDPHFGNYKIADDGTIILLDFGCVRQFSKPFLSGIPQLYNALKTNDHDAARNAYETWGFNNLTTELVDALNIWARYLYTPLMDNRKRPLIDSPNAGKEAASAVLSALKKTGKVQPPREFVFMDRAAVGIGSAMIHLDVELNWHTLFMELTQHI